MSILKKWILTIILTDLFVLTYKYFSKEILHAQLCRIHELLIIQLLMAIFSTILYQRFAKLACRNFKFREVLRLVVLTFLILSHSAYFLFYIYLPENSFVSLVSFLCVSIYVHLAVFLLSFICMEQVCYYAFSDSNFLFTIKKFFTIFACFLAISFTIAGIIVTKQNPKIRYENILISTLGTEFDGFKIALITDVHIGPTVSKHRVENIVKLVNKEKPDIITIVGDLVDGFFSNLYYRALPLANLKSKYGTFFATGNHEYYHGDVNQWLEFFKKNLSLTILRNSNQIIKKSHGLIKENSYSNNSICIAGVDDIITEHLFIRNHKMDAEKAVKNCPKNSVIIFLAHQPNAARKIIDTSKRKIDLILSGHTHGGQFYIFWLLAYWKNAFLYGLYRDELSKTQVFVSSGVNYWGPPVKMQNLCEIVILNLHH